MTQTGFIAAMATRLAFAAYDSPATLEPDGTEWFIVSIWGTNREFLTLSRTNVAVQGHEAPPGLQPCSTNLGILLSRFVADGEEASEYLLMRNQPPDIPVGGVFHPTDGFARLTLRDGIPRLTAHGRFAHTAGTLSGRRVIHDVPNPAPGAQQARAWHLTACRRPWIGEFIPSDDASTRAPVIARVPALVRSQREAPVHSVPPRGLQSRGVQSRGKQSGGVQPRGGQPLAAQPQVAAPPDPGLAPAGSAPHTRRRKRPEAKHDVTTEA